MDISKLPPPAAAAIDFTRDVKPILENSCLRCHGTERPRSKFSLATREAALKGGDNGIAIIAGDSAKSPLIHYVTGLVPDMMMPPEDKGDPLTRDQIALLRAWIDQGVVWETVDMSAEYEAKFSFTPAVRWVTVQGNAQKFMEHQWVKRGFSEGVSDFRISQKTTNGTSFFIEGRAFTEDYKITLDIRKDELGFARFGIEQFRHYYDDYGPYYRFRPSGFATQTRSIYSLDRDLHLDVGKAFAEFGVTRPNWPQITVGYEYHYRNGEQSTEEWGEVTQRNNSSPTELEQRHYYPAYKQINEDVHVLRLDASHDIKGIRVEDNLRAEFVDIKTTRIADRRFAAGQASPTILLKTRESHDELLLANTLRGEKSINDWLFASAGYLFSHADADATFRQENVNSANVPVAGPYWLAQGITLEENAHVFSASTLGGPWDGFTAALGVQNEWSDRRGFGQVNYGVVGDPPRGFIESQTDRWIVEENLVLRYTKIPATVLFAEARWKQERTDFTEVQTAEHGFLRDSDVAANRQDYKAGFTVSPWHWASLNASYKLRRSESDYDEDIDANLPRNTNDFPRHNRGAFIAFLESSDGYPAFIRWRETEADVFETKLVLRPLTWLKTTLTYQLALTDYRTRTDAVTSHDTNDVEHGHTPGGQLLAGEYDAATYSANVTLTPWRRWYFSGTISYQDARTWTADGTSALVVPYRGDVYSVMASTTFAWSERTELRGSYTFSRGRFAQDNAPLTVPLGIDYDSHGVQLGVMHRFHTNLTASVQYGFYDYSEPTAHGVADYTAHMVFGALGIRLP